MRRRLPPAWGTAAGWVLVSLPIGLVVGGLWVLLSPRVVYRVSGGEVARISSQPEEYFGSDLTLGALLLVAGVIAAMWWLFRLRDRWVATVVGLAVGGAMAGLIAAELGRVLTHTTLTAAGLPDGATLTEGLSLRSPALLLWWPCIVAVVVGTVVVWCGGAEGLRISRRLLFSRSTPPDTADSTAS